MSAVDIVAMIEKAGAVCLVIGPKTDTSQIDVVADLGGGWRGGVQLWRGMNVAYLVLLADSRNRIKRLAPLIFVARDQGALIEATDMACDRLAGKQCVWLVTDEGAGGQQVRDYLAVHSAVEGHA